MTMYSDIRKLLMEVQDVQPQQLVESVVDKKNESETEQDSIPFNGPYKKGPAVIKDKSGAKHTPQSRARSLAKRALAAVQSKKNESVNEGDKMFDDDAYRKARDAADEAQIKAENSDSVKDHREAWHAHNRASKLSPTIHLMKAHKEQARVHAEASGRHLGESEELDEAVSPQSAHNVVTLAGAKPGDSYFEHDDDTRKQIVSYGKRNGIKHNTSSRASGKDLNRHIWDTMMSKALKHKPTIKNESEELDEASLTPSQHDAKAKEAHDQFVQAVRQGNSVMAKSFHDEHLHHKQLAKSKRIANKVIELPTFKNESVELDEALGARDKLKKLQSQLSHYSDKAVEANRNGDDEMVIAHQKKMNQIKSQMSKIAKNESEELDEASNVVNNRTHTVHLVTHRVNSISGSHVVTDRIAVPKTVTDPESHIRKHISDITSIQHAQFGASSKQRVLDNNGKLHESEELDERVSMLPKTKRSFLTHPAVKALMKKWPTLSPEDRETEFNKAHDEAHAAVYSKYKNPEGSVYHAQLDWVHPVHTKGWLKDKLDKQTNEGKTMKSFTSFMEEMNEAIDEGKIDDLRDRQQAARVAGTLPPKLKEPEGNVKTVKGSRYGGSKQKEDDEEGETPSQEAGEKRGRGRPKGAVSGARTKGSDGGHGGTDDYHLNLPTKSVYY